MDNTPVGLKNVGNSKLFLKDLFINSLLLQLDNLIVLLHSEFRRKDFAGVHYRLETSGTNKKY